MEKQSMEACSCRNGIDEMINEGLGGGFIIYDYDAEKLEQREAVSERNVNS
ncbi:hypothetical protein [Virgibacillus profundi]|uniref:hypothetical protein n=1 Tax=Virgibacillus profundi TaxID=2024555 RepID=UPI0013FE2294|nr:hypothetical protein [Virgibacillus profundi]